MRTCLCRTEQESPEINSWVYDQLACDKEAKNMQQGNDNLYNTWYWGN